MFQTVPTCRMLQWNCGTVMQVVHMLATLAWILILVPCVMVQCALEARPQLRQPLLQPLLLLLVDLAPEVGLPCLAVVAPARAPRRRLA